MVSAAALINSVCFAQSLPELAPEIVFTVQGEGQDVVVRALTRATTCPAVSWDEQPQRRMDVRAAAATPALRGDSAQKDSKPLAKLTESILHRAEIARFCVAYFSVIMFA